MTEETTPRRQRRDLRERRQERMERSATNQDKFWDDRLAAAKTPLDLYEQAYSMLRTRLVKWEAKASKAVDRAGTDKAREAALEQLEAARADVERICREIAGELSQAADQINTTRR